MQSHDVTQPGSPPAAAGLASADHRISRRYIATLLALPLIATLVIIPLTRYLPASSPFESSAGFVNEYRYQMKHVDADLLIYGDSSASRNLDPLIIGPELHMKVANIGGDAQSLQILRNGPVEYYLKYNKPPKFIVLAAASWDLVPQPLSSNNSFDGNLMIVRHYPVSEVVHYVMSHPAVMFNFNFQVLERLTHYQRWIKLRQWKEADQQFLQEMRTHAGFIPQGIESTSPQQSLGADCAMDAPQVDVSRSGTIADDFVREFSTSQTKTLVYLSAVPDCAGYERYIKVQSPKPWLLPASVVPHDYMIKDTALIHGRIADVPALSHIAAIAIRGAIDKTIPAPLSTGR